MIAALVSLALTVGSQAPSTNTACAVLTPAQVASLIGDAKTLPMTNAAAASTCMFQNKDKLVTVLVSTVSTAEAARGFFNSKKAIVAGTDITGWAAPAYAGTLKGAAACGVLKQQTVTEVKVIDSTQKPEVMSERLQALMRDFAARP